MWASRAASRSEQCGGQEGRCTELYGVSGVPVNHLACSTRVG